MLTAITNVIALAVILLVGTPAAYLLGTRRFRGRALVITLVELPLVLPPDRGRHRAPGGVRRPHRPARGRPRSAQGQRRLHHHRRRDRGLLRGRRRSTCARRSRRSRRSTRTSSTPPASTARARSACCSSISIPLASAGLAAGAALAFARGIGEFGATIMFAGNLRGVTQTLPLLIYQDFELELRRRARDRRAARDRQRGRPDRRQAACAPARQGAQRETARSSSALSGPAADGVRAPARCDSSLHFLILSRVFLCFT